jgi:hypothetical protein
MAYIVPSDISLTDQSHPRSRELETLVMLKKDLTDDFTVFHSVHWSRAYEKYTVFGEVDFVVVNRAGNILLIEQKNGPLDEIDGELSKRYAHRSKNPVDQVVRSRDNIIEKFRYQYGRLPRLAIDYLVYCPDHRIGELIAASLDRSRIVDASRQHQLAECIEELMGRGKPDAFTHEKVIEFFQHTFHLVPDIHARQLRLNERFVQLSQGLVKFINNLQIEPFRLRVVGTAGCGKSLLAAQRYVLALEQGKRVLMLCFNRSLASMLQQRLPLGGEVNSWHGFCRDLLASRGQAVDFSQVDRPDFWPRVAEKMIGLELADSDRFDTIIVDEAQEFREIWWLFLKDYCLRENGEVLWLEDQCRSDDNQFMPEGIAVSYHARENFRSPYKIARYVNRQFPEFEFEPANGIAGLDMGQYSVASESLQIGKVEKILTSLLGQGLKPADIVILTCREPQASVFFNCTALADVPLRHITGEYDDHGEPLCTEGEMRFTSVARFTGQQSPAVILVDVDLESGEQLQQRRRTAFIGMTRASLRLDVVNIPSVG